LLQMESVTKVQLLREPIDEFKNGPVSIKAMNAPAHPVQVIQQKAELTQNMMQKALAARVFGSHMAMRMQMEEVRPRDASTQLPRTLIHRIHGNPCYRSFDLKKEMPCSPVMPRCCCDHAMTRRASFRKCVADLG
jgi:hypothetical protein